MWDDQPPERVMLDYFMVRAAKEQEAKQMEKMNREAKRGGSANKGRPLRTTSDADGLDDFFDRINESMRD
jgi:hypothetical protein